MSWERDDNRNEITRDPEQDDCQDCGAPWNQPCVYGCPCAHCTGKRAREAARRVADDKDAA